MTENAGHAVSISVPIPAEDASLYGNKSVDGTLKFLTLSPFDEFSLAELADRSEHSAATVRRGVSVLVANDLAETRTEGHRKLVRINRDRLTIPEDPILRVPQAPYHEPVRAAVDRLGDELSDVVGIVLYGSVARGDADRRSDIDLWVVVDDGRAENQRAANAIKDELEQRRFGRRSGAPGDDIEGDRYEFHIVVESVESIPSFEDDVREIVLSGIPLYVTEEFATLRNALAHGVDDE
jgi:predicted nucleotidyltransferase